MVDWVALKTYCIKVTIQLLNALLPSGLPKAMHLAFAVSKFKLPVFTGAATTTVAGAAGAAAGVLDFSEPSISKASVNKGPACAWPIKLLSVMAVISNIRFMVLIQWVIEKY